MKIAVFDTYAKTQDGKVLHFDVLMPDSDESLAVTYAEQWLREIGLDSGDVELTSCRYCHNEDSAPGVIQIIREQGFYILQMEGCPAPE
jgi:hypothetical protein